MIYLNLPQHHWLITIALKFYKSSPLPDQVFDPSPFSALRPHRQYSICRSQLLMRSMSISVWHHGRLSRNAFLGEVEIPLVGRDLNSPREDRMALMAKVEHVPHDTVWVKIDIF